MDIHANDFASTKALYWLLREAPTAVVMLGRQLQHRQVRRSQTDSVGDRLGHTPPSNHRMVVLCEDIPSGGSTEDSGRSSSGSRARSGSGEPAGTWTTRTLQGGEERRISISSGGWTRQGWAQETRRSKSSGFDGQNPGSSTLCIRD